MAFAIFLFLLAITYAAKSISIIFQHDELAADDTAFSWISATATQPKR